MTSSLILNLDYYNLKEDYTQEFNKEYGIIDMKPTGIQIENTMEMELFFKDEESKIRFIKELESKSGVYNWIESEDFEEGWNDALDMGETLLSTI